MDGFSPLWWPGSIGDIQYSLSDGHGPCASVECTDDRPAPKFTAQHGGDNMEVISSASPRKRRFWRPRPDLRLVRPGDPPQVRDPGDDFLFIVMIAAFCLLIAMFGGFIGTWTGGNGGPSLKTGSGWSAASWR